MLVKRTSALILSLCACLAGSACTRLENRQSGWPEHLASGVGNHAASARVNPQGSASGALVTEQMLTSGPHNARETSMAVQGNNPLHAVAAIMGDASNKGIDTAATFDGGLNWTLGNIPQAAGAVFEADPMLAIDAQGIAYLAHIPVDSFTNTNLGIDVHRSLDGGLTWTPMVRLTNDAVPRDARDDKVAIAVDDHPGSPYFGNVYVAWKLPPGPMFFARSSNQGLSWTGPITIPSLGVAGLDLATAEDGTVLLSFNQGFADGVTRLNIQVQRSTDQGDSWQAPAQIALNRSAFNIQPAGACNAPGAHVQTSLGLRLAAHPLGRSMWVSWNDYLPGVPFNCSKVCSAANTCRSGVYISHSDDLGLTWSTPERVPGLDAVAGDQFFSWADVDAQTGELLVAFKDTARDPNRMLADVVLRRSADGSVWQAPVTLSGAASTTTSTFQGDYVGMAAAGGHAYMAWPDYRNRPLGDFYVASANFDAIFQDGFDAN
ncbi:MAG: exo-alpha-sialidase [Xanthomonadales bacterium]|nr:exo-alpha-sialidase [Xanthomonadales bacterium]MCB1578518.1 exo-alpha-sialidase [Xanthomonadales bacterium]